MALPNVRVTSDGKVGVATPSPSSPLTVNGTIESTSGGVKLPDGTVIQGSGDLGAGGGGSRWSLSGNSGTTPGTNFLGTTDETALELKVNGERALRIEPATDANGFPAPNVIAGAPANAVTQAAGATISGGAPGSKNEVTANFGTVGGGSGNTASGFNATVSGGLGNTASASDATVGGGNGNTASGSQATVGGGNSNTASIGNATVSGGRRNTASAQDATVGGGERNVADGIDATVGGGFGNTASGNNATVSGGQFNTASGFNGTVPGGASNEAKAEGSFAAGTDVGVKPSHEGSFIWGDATDTAFDSDSLVSTGKNQFLVRAEGGFGLGTSDPAGQLHVQDDLANQGVSDSPGGNMVLFENTNDGTNPDVLGLQAGPTDPGSGVTYVSFYQRDGTTIGTIEGNGSGGVNFNTTGSDYAEELPMRPGATTASPRDLVAVRGGEVSLKTADANRLMIVTDRAAVTGNAAQNSDRPRVPVAFVGQVPVRLRGSAAAGDLIVASGHHDGTARAVSPGNYRPGDHGPIAGRAWSAKSSSGSGTVTVAVGLDQSGALVEQLQRQRSRILEQNRQIQSQGEQLESLKERVRRLESLIQEQSNSN